MPSCLQRESTNRFAVSDNLMVMASVFFSSVMSDCLLDSATNPAESLAELVGCASPDVCMPLNNGGDSWLRNADLVGDLYLSPAISQEEIGMVLNVHTPIISYLISEVKQKSDCFRYQNAVMNTTFGERLKESRKDAKLSQVAAAKRVGVSQGLISDLENNVYDASAKTIELAHLYRVNPYWLATGNGNKKDVPMTPEEQELISVCRTLSNTKQGEILIVAKYEASKKEAEGMRDAMQSSTKKNPRLS